MRNFLTAAILYILMGKAYMWNSYESPQCLKSFTIYLEIFAICIFRPYQVIDQDKNL